MHGQHVKLPNWTVMRVYWTVKVIWQVEGSGGLKKKTESKQ